MLYLLKSSHLEVNIDFQIKPHNMLWQNSAECAIQNFKNHFISGFSTTDTNFKEEVSRGHTVTYSEFVCDYLQLKSKPFQICLTVGGDRLGYPDDAASQAASLLESKLLFNSTISDAHRGAIFLSCDMNIFY